MSMAAAISLRAQFKEHHHGIGVPSVTQIKELSTRSVVVQWQTTQCQWRDRGEYRLYPDIHVACRAGPTADRASIPNHCGTIIIRLLLEVLGHWNTGPLRNRSLDKVSVVIVRGLWTDFAVVEGRNAASGRRAGVD